MAAMFPVRGVQVLIQFFELCSSRRTKGTELIASQSLHMPSETRKAPSSLEEPLPKRRALAKSTNEINSAGFSECFKVVRTSMYVSLAPCYIDNPINGIKTQHLDPMVMTYFSKAHGVVISYFNISIEDKCEDQSSHQLLAKITDSSAFSFKWISVDLLIWSPQIGDKLEGFVYMQTSSHIGLLVHDTFNASIKFRNIPQDWEFVPNKADETIEGDVDPGKQGKFRSYGYWVDGNGSKVDGKISFTVRTVHTTGRMLSIEGTLVSPESELEEQSDLSNAIANGSVTTSAKHITFDDEPLPEVTKSTQENGESDSSNEEAESNSSSSSSSAEESD